MTRQARLAGEIAAVLGPHTFVEEHGLFPALATDFPGHIAILEAEHQADRGTARRGRPRWRGRRAAYRPRVA